MKRFRDEIIFVAGIVAGLAGIATTLQWLGVTPKDLRISMPTVGLLIATILLFLVSLTTSVYAFITSRRRSLVGEIAPVAEILQSLTLVDLYPECSPSEAEWTYKSKVRAVLKNQTGEVILVEGVRWQAGATGIPAQDLKPSFQLEGPKGWEAGDWGSEQKSLRVPPGKAFRLFVGLDLDIARPVEVRNTDIRRRFVTKRLGTLTITFRQAGSEHESSMQL